MIICPLCLASKGISGKDLDPKNSAAIFDDKDIEGFANHMENEHHKAVQMKDETVEACISRFIEKYPESQDPRTCKCPSCKMRRGDGREKLAMSIREIVARRKE